METRIVKDSTSSRRFSNVLAIGLVATLSAPLSSCAFDEDDLIFKNNKSMYTSKSFDENIESKRLIDYSKSRYSEEEDVKIESSLITTSNFAFQGMIQIFSESQIELDGEIQAALNDFTRISRKTSPTKNRFKA